jgi:phosphohistidine swiveling domain-containing protein
MALPVAKPGLVLPLDDTAAPLALVGGKGASLARLAAAGLAVPRGFHVTTEAYRGFVGAGGLQERIVAAAARGTVDRPDTFEAAAREIGSLFAERAMPVATAGEICAAYAAMGGEPAVAVRSSATAEDLPGMSFAGQQESFLNIRGDAGLLDAVKRCWASLWTARAMDYRARHGIASGDVSLAVVVQELVPADAAGVLFTAHPVTGGGEQAHINAAWGLGEAVVGGKVTADAYVVDKATGNVDQQEIGDKAVMTVRTGGGTREEPVPAERRRLAVLDSGEAAELARLGVRIERLYGQPMDIEWARAEGRFFILQARPITGARARTPVLETWNDSLAGDYLWTSTNLGEAIPDVMTPCTWSILERFMEDAMVARSIAGHRLCGNIGGRFYMNMSVMTTMAAAFGMKRRLAAATEQVFGHLPPGMEIPLIEVSRWRLIRELVPLVFRTKRRMRAHMKKLPAFLREAAEGCEALHAKIRGASSGAALRALWSAELEPLFRTACQMLQAAGRQDGSALVTIRHELREQVGESDANALTTGLHAGGSQLASLGPLVGLVQLARGEIDRATYSRLYGHRSAHEFEVSTPRPVEDPEWIDKQLAGLREAAMDPSALLARQEAARTAAWHRLEARAPRRASAWRRKVERWAASARDREAARSELMRVFRVLRAYVLRAAALTGHGDELFFLTIEEILGLLGGDAAGLAAIPSRRATYERYRALPPYPTLLVGRFDPFSWAADPERRSDVFDARGTPAPSDTIAGFPGAAGVVEGVVRVLATPEEGESLRAGEVLVTTVTNIGWTPLFPRASAIVTDVGAPLSHAAIVARELGIPAVVGCGNATMRLRTGDRVRVDGEHGTVEVLQAAAGGGPRVGVTSSERVAGGSGRL